MARVRDYLAWEVFGNRALRRGDYLFVGHTISIADILKEIHQALNANRPEFYAIPEDPRLVAQELLLFENTGTGRNWRQEPGEIWRSFCSESDV